MKVVSMRDELELTDSAVVIRKYGIANALASGMNGERSIDPSQITGITFKKGGMLSPQMHLYLRRL
jgi:hypothetical protein